MLNTETLESNSIRLAAKVTSAEKRVATLIRQGLTNREIATVLCRSEHTVKTQVHQLLTKLGARNRAQLAALSVSTKSE
jgi:DNA-binding NarL/FixJ family response regulator